MEDARIIEIGKRLSERILGADNLAGPHAELENFLRVVCPKNTVFIRSLDKLRDTKKTYNTYKGALVSILDAFLEQLQSGLINTRSIEQEARLDVVSDFLEQSQIMLEDKNVHPVAPAILIGASLEEFLRNWVDAEDLGIGPKKPSIDAYAKSLREAGLIKKQDIKDITSWAGVRNDAAHGVFDNVLDRDRIRLILEAVNLFMRRYGAS